MKAKIGVFALCCFALCAAGCVHLSVRHRPAEEGVCAGVPAVKKAPAGKASAAQKKPASKPRRLTADVVVFYDLQLYDLDGDGVQEIVATYRSTANSTAVKVFRVVGKPESCLVVAQVFPNTCRLRFTLWRRQPALVAVGARGVLDWLFLKPTRYLWNGKEFVPQER